MSSIRDSRNARLLNRAFRQLAKIGKLPKFAAVFNSLRKLLGRDKSGSMLEPAVMKSGETFPLTDFNKNLEDINFELGLLYDEALFRGTRVVESSVILEEQVAELRRQLLKIRETTERELLVAGSNFLDAIAIRFADRTKIDTDLTTAAVSTDAGFVTLPLRAGSQRVVLQSAPTSPNQIEAEGDIRVLPGSNFASIFSDTLGAWQAATDSTWLRLRVDLGERANASRIELRSPDSGMRVDLRVSSDGINFIRPSPAASVLAGGVNFLFESQDIRFVEFLFTKTPSDQGQVFTVDTLALYSWGYQPSAVLVTNALSPENGGNIKVASVEVDADIPPNCWVDLEVAGDAGDFVKVENKVIDFTQSSLGRVRFTIAADVLYSYSSLLGTRGFTTGTPTNDGIAYNDVWGVDETDAFGTNPLPASIPASVDARSLKLFRINNWGYESRKVEETVNGRCRLAMDNGERRRLYRPVNEESVRNGGSTTTTITVARPIISGANVSVVGDEDAQIIKVTGTLDPVSMSVPPVWAGTVVLVGTGADREIKVVATFDPLVSSFDTLFIEGVGEVAIVRYDLANDTVYIDPTTEISAGAVSVRVQSRDLTKYVDSAVDRTITFSVDIQDYERLIISYNSPLDEVNEILISSSVRVQSTRDSSLVGQPGRDYRIERSTLEMLRTTTLPTDATTSAFAVDVSFQYVRTYTSAVSYWAYVVVPPGPNRIVQLQNPFQLLNSERVVWTNPAGKAVDMEGLDNLVLTPGTHRFSVVGVRAIDDTGKLDTSSALYKLVNLRAVNGGWVFDPAANYISSITGFPEPMMPTSRFFLERAARKDDTTHFAWEDNAILTTMDMRDPENSVTIQPSNDTALNQSDYMLEYRYFRNTGVTAMRVRLTLNRDPAADVSATPVIRGILIRFTE